jgi:creatinine amidohydrolase
VIIPVAALEQHGLHGPIGTDFYNAVEQAKLVAQRTDVLVAPILLPGNSPYHMGFPGTITLSAETIERTKVHSVRKHKVKKHHKARHHHRQIERPAADVLMPWVRR